MTAEDNAPGIGGKTVDNSPMLGGDRRIPSFPDLPVLPYPFPPEHVNCRSAEIFELAPDQDLAFFPAQDQDVISLTVGDATISARVTALRFLDSSDVLNEINAAFHSLQTSEEMSGEIEFHIDPRESHGFRIENSFSRSRDLEAEDGVIRHAARQLIVSRLRRFEDDLLRRLYEMASNVQNQDGEDDIE